jgi:hypothetical protein
VIVCTQDVNNVTVNQRMRANVFCVRQAQLILEHTRPTIAVVAEAVQEDHLVVKSLMTNARRTVAECSFSAGTVAAVNALLCPSPFAVDEQ